MKDKDTNKRSAKERDIASKSKQSKKVAKFFKIVVYVFLCLSFTTLIVLVIFFFIPSSREEGTETYSWFKSLEVLLIALTSVTLCFVPVNVAVNARVGEWIKESDVYVANTEKLLTKLTSIIESPHYTFVKTVLKTATEEKNLTSLCDDFHDYRVNSLYYNTFTSRISIGDFSIEILKQIILRSFYLPEDDPIRLLIPNKDGKNDFESFLIGDKSDKTNADSETKDDFADDKVAILGKLFDIFYSYAIDVMNHFETICVSYWKNKIDNDVFEYEIAPAIDQYYRLFYPLLRYTGKHGSFDKADFVCRLIYQKD